MQYCTKQVQGNPHSGPLEPMRLRMHKWIAEPVDPRSEGEVSRIMMAAGARHISLSAKPTRRKANDCSNPPASTLHVKNGAAAIVAPRTQHGTPLNVQGHVTWTLLEEDSASALY